MVAVRGHRACARADMHLAAGDRGREGTAVELSPASVAAAVRHAHLQPRPGPTSNAEEVERSALAPEFVDPAVLLHPQVPLTPSFVPLPVFSLSPSLPLSLSACLPASLSLSPCRTHTLSITLSLSLFRSLTPSFALARSRATLSSLSLCV